RIPLATPVWVALWISILSCCAIVAFAQQPLGTIVGTVTDATGASVPSATITVTNVHTNATPAVAPSTTGDFSVPYLANGTYTITAEYSGFRTAVTSGVVVRAAQTVRADIRLEVGEIKETLEVSAAARALQMDTAVVGTTIDSRSVNDLPLNGRTFAQL